MENQEQNANASTQKEPPKEPPKEEAKEESKPNVNISLSNINQTETKREKTIPKENEMTYEQYIDSLEEDEKNKVKEIFELFDKNLDGGVDMKELKFILNSLDIYPNHDELSAMMAEADVANKGYINESDFKYIIAKQKKEYRDKLMKEAKDAFIALGGDPDLHTKISTGKIQEILRKEFELSDKVKMVYNILGDRPETIAEFMVQRIEKNTKNNVKLTWLTKKRAFGRFMKAPFKKNNYFLEEGKGE